MQRAAAAGLLLALVVGCSPKKYAIRQVGDALNSGASVWETDDDIELVGDALPFSLKFVESLLAEVPDDPDLLVTACRGFTLYTYGYVAPEAERVINEDLDRGRAIRGRAAKLYRRAYEYGFDGLEAFYPGFEQALIADPVEAVKVINPKKAARDLPFLYWTAAALGLGISVSRDDAAMLARLPEVEAMIGRALDLEPDWDDGALHAFQVTLASSKIGGGDREAIDRHFRRAEELSQGRSAGLYVAYAEAVAVPAQDAALFRSLLEKALAVETKDRPDDRLANLLAQRRARRLLDEIGDLFLILDEPEKETTP